MDWEARPIMPQRLARCHRYGRQARQARRLAAVSAGVLVLAPAPDTRAQDYPTRPIHVLVGFPAGSGADIGVRFVAERLQDVAKARVIVENRPGAGSNIAIGIAVRAKPDGYTLLLAASSAMAGSRYLYKDFKIDTENELEPVALVWRSNFVLSVAPASPFGSVADLTRHLKGKDKSLHAYSNQTGQLAAAYYLARVGATSSGVNYRGAAEAVADLGSGTIDFMMLDGSFAAGQLRAGRVKPLAVTAARRSSSTPDTPTMQEAGLPGFEFSPFWAAYVPKGTPAPIVERLGKWLIEVAHSEATRERFLVSGSMAVGEGPEAARAALKTEIERWAVAVKAAGVEPQ